MLMGTSEHPHDGPRDLVLDVEEAIPILNNLLVVTFPFILPKTPCRCITLPL